MQVLEQAFREVNQWQDVCERMSCAFRRRCAVGVGGWELRTYGVGRPLRARRRTDMDKG
jgi:hypothetical protein